MKIFWKIAEAPTGRYKSFDKRGWPTGYYDKDKNNIAAAICCRDAYSLSRAKEGRHGELTICVADHSVTPWQWRTLKKKAVTLAEAKELVVKFLEANPHYRGE